MNLTQITEWVDGKLRRIEDYLAVEEPLEIRSGRYPLGISMRTPGNDLDLAAGFLFTEGIVTRREQILSIKAARLRIGRAGTTANTVRVRLGQGARVNPNALRRRFSAGSACGICGKAAIGEIRRRGVLRPDADSRFTPEMLCQLPDKLRAAQAIFGRTGGLHAAALFNADGKLLVLREDIGRHNAVDKVLGWAFMEGLTPLSRHAVLVSGRGGFEIVQKVLVAGVPLLASVSAPSSLAVQLARELNLTFVGFLRGRRLRARRPVRDSA